MCYTYLGDIMQEFINKLNYALLTSPLYWTLIIICAIFIFICLKYGNKIIGWFGELWTKQALNRLDIHKYIVLNDIMIEVSGKTHQIDHIVISRYGIFVIETKQYNGYIKGDRYDNKWVRYIKGREPIYYTNPIRQNYGHVKAICELLNISEDKVFNIVCISSNAKLNIKHDGEVTRNYEIYDKITSYKEEIIDNIELISNKINIHNIVDKDKRKSHIESININKKEYGNNTCPKCGGKLVERISKYGKFMGCENYPRCKYTKKH